MKRQTEVATFMGLPFSMVQRRVTLRPTPWRTSWKAGSTTGGTGDRTEQQTGVSSGDSHLAQRGHHDTASEETGDGYFQGDICFLSGDRFVGLKAAITAWRLLLTGLEPPINSLPYIR